MMRQSKTYVYFFFSTLIFLLVYLGCKSNSQTSDKQIFLGGEIVNPKNNKVVVYKVDEKTSDTLILNENNRFSYTIPNSKSGVFSFWHGGEFQLVLLEPNDSIMLRLNTYDFDESLVFSGTGSKKNNYLIKTYLFNEAERKKLMSYCKMEPEEFSSFIEDRRQKQLEEFKEFKSHEDISEFFETIMTANINYHAYADKEIYPFAYFGNNQLIHHKDLPEDFYNHRSAVDLNADHLGNFYFYNRFLFSHFDNLALHAYYKNSEDHNAFNRHALDYNLAKLTMIDSMISSKTIKNKLLKYKTRDFISFCSEEEKLNHMLNHFLDLSSSEKDKKDISDLVNALEALSIGNKLPDLEVVNLKNESRLLQNIIDKPTIIYFWTSNLKSQYRNSHYRVQSLRRQYKDIDFISININDSDDKYWEKIINQYDFSHDYEYKFKNSRTSLKKLAVNYVNKAIIVDKDSRIIHPNINIFNTDFEAFLSTMTE